MHEHHARRLHFDFLLEMNGALRNWAVPKEPPERVGERRLAVQVKNHPLDHIEFEGAIPKSSMARAR